MYTVTIRTENIQHETDVSGPWSLLGTYQRIDGEIPVPRSAKIKLPNGASAWMHLVGKSRTHNSTDSESFVYQIQRLPVYGAEHAYCGSLVVLREFPMDMHFMCHGDALRVSERKVEIRFGVWHSGKQQNFHSKVLIDVEATIKSLLEAMHLAVNHPVFQTTILSIRRNIMPRTAYQTKIKTEFCFTAWKDAIAEPTFVTNEIAATEVNHRSEASNVGQRSRSRSPSDYFM